MKKQGNKEFVPLHADIPATLEKVLETAGSVSEFCRMWGLRYISFNRVLRGVQRFHPAPGSVYQTVLSELRRRRLLVETRTEEKQAA